MGEGGGGEVGAGSKQGFVRKMLAAAYCASFKPGRSGMVRLDWATHDGRGEGSPRSAKGGVGGLEGSERPEAG